VVYWYVISAADHTYEHKLNLPQDLHTRLSCVCVILELDSGAIQYLSADGSVVKDLLLLKKIVIRDSSGLSSDYTLQLCETLGCSGHAFIQTFDGRIRGANTRNI
jgi:hypothetical protein